MGDERSWHTHLPIIFQLPKNSYSTRISARPAKKARKQAVSSGDTSSQSVTKSGGNTDIYYSRTQGLKYMLEGCVSIIVGTLNFGFLLILLLEAEDREPRWLYSISSH